ncbi:hypothetical protein AWN80_18875 [Clostridioides difficile]|nr:hypothetical protein AWN80_18875 [Clostridioides difficile]
MVSACICVSTPVLGHNNGCHQCLSPQGGGPSLGRTHLSWRCAQSLSRESLFSKGLCTFLSGDFRLLSEMGEFVHGPFKTQVFSAFIP